MVISDKLFSTLTQYAIPPLKAMWEVEQLIAHVLTIIEQTAQNYT